METQSLTNYLNVLIRLRYGLSRSIGCLHGPSETMASCSTALASTATQGHTAKYTTVHAYSPIRDAAPECVQDDRVDSGHETPPKYSLDTCLRGFV